MDNIIRIKDINAAELDVYARLTQAQLKNRACPEKGLFIAEGHKVAEIALAAGLEPVSFLMEEKHACGKAAGLIAACPGVPVYVADEAVLETLTGYRLTRGVLCAMKRPEAKSPVEVCRGRERIAVVEDVVDASNLGAIFRCAAALGMEAVLLSPRCCDPLYRKAVRTSMGTVFQIPWARAEGNWPGESFEMLKEQGFRTAALALGRESLSLEDERIAAAEKLAVVLGTEGSGLREETVAACDWSVYIPMQAGVDSLNVAAAAAVAFWQLRKR